MQPWRDEDGEYKQQDFQAGAHRASDMGSTAPVITTAAAFAAKIGIRRPIIDISHSRYFAREILLNLWTPRQTQL
jgi:hypothetical protein